jgi:glycosyltransferase involved in cell wall biosynthesis
MRGIFMTNVTQNPLVSIIIRTKDRPKFVMNALRSVAAQGYRPIEVVLVNDGGCDLDIGAIKGLLGDISLNYIRLEKNAGRAHAGNVGIEKSTGEYLGFLDDDDSIYADHLSTLLKVMINYDCKIAYSDADIAYVDPSSGAAGMKAKNRQLFSSKDFSYDELLMDNYIPLICVLFSKDIIGSVNGFDETFELYEDWDLLIRVGELCRFHHVGKATAEYLQWSPALQIAQRPESADKARESYLRIVRKHRKKYKPDVIWQLVQHKRALANRERTLEHVQSAKTDLERVLLKKDESIKKLLNMRETLEQRLGQKEETIEFLMNSKAGIESLTMDQLREIRTSLDCALGEREDLIEELKSARVNLEQTLGEREDLIEELKSVRVNLEQTLGERDGVIEDLKSARANLEQTLGEREDLIEELKSVRVNLEQTLGERDGVIEDLKSARANLEQTLSDIFNSHGWRFLLVYYGLRDRLLPLDSRRRKMVKAFWREVRSAFATLRGLRATTLRHFLAGLKRPVPRQSGEALTAVQTANSSGEACYTGASTAAKERRRECYRGNSVNVDMVRQGGNGGRRCSVLVAGVYLANQENVIEHIIDHMKRSKYHTVTQRWAALFGEAPSEEVKAVTAFGSMEAVPKFVMLNRILSGEALERYDYVVLCDDDVLLPTDFLDAFLFLQEKYDFAVAQPARTHNSYIDHPFVERFDGLNARRTRFVEIGPLVSIRRDAFSALLPFDESSYMGWGYDFVWPCIIENMGLRMGIIDAAPIDHSIRSPVENYNYDEANKSQEAYLSKNPHLSKDEAFRILESYA